MRRDSRATSTCMTTFYILFSLPSFFKALAHYLPKFPLKEAHILTFFKHLFMCSNSALTRLCPRRGHVQPSKDLRSVARGTNSVHWCCLSCFTQKSKSQKRDLWMACLTCTPLPIATTYILNLSLKLERFWTCKLNSASQWEDGKEGLLSNQSHVIKCKGLTCIYKLF